MAKSWTPRGLGHGLRRQRFAQAQITNGFRITSPAPGSVLAGTDQVFSWSSTSARFRFAAGSAEGGDNIVPATDVVSGNSQFQAVGLPTNGSTVWITIWHKADDDEDYQRTSVAYTSYRETFEQQPPSLLAPEQGSTLVGSVQAFSWAPNGASQFRLSVGTSTGNYNLYDVEPIVGATKTVTDLPVDGSTVYVRLGYKFPNSADWLYLAEQTFLAFDQGAPVAPAITTPEPASSLTSDSMTLDWSPNDAVEFRVAIGTSAGANNLYQSGDLGAIASHVISGLPQDGRIIWTTLSYQTETDGAWHNVSPVRYQCYLQPVIPVLLSPGADTELLGTSQAFAWNEGTATEFLLKVGTTAGGSDIVNLGPLDDVSSANVEGLPDDGRELFVTLAYREGSESFIDTASIRVFAYDRLPVITSHVPTQSLAREQATFVWNKGAATDFKIDVGRVENGSDIYQGAALGDTDTLTVDNLPVSGIDVYVTMAYKKPADAAFSKLPSLLLKTHNDITDPYADPVPPNFTIPVDDDALYKIKAGNYRILINRTEKVRENFPMENMFGININQKNMINVGDPVDAVVTSALAEAFPDISYRLGGNVSQGYNWLATEGTPVASRPQWQDIFTGVPQDSRFGVDELHDFTTRSRIDVNDPNPITWVANLVTTDSTNVGTKEADSVVAAQNALLSQRFQVRFRQKTGMMVQLGNENDRFSNTVADYQWEPAVLTASMQANVDAIRGADPHARFIGFIRHHDYTYKAPHALAGQVYTWQSLVDAVYSVNGVTDVGFHAYINTKNLDGNQSFPAADNYSVPYYLGEYQKVIDYIQSETGPNVPARMHVTEYARRQDTDQLNTDDTVKTQGSVGGAIGNVDLLLGAISIPEIHHATVHALHAGAWRLVDDGVVDGGLDPLPVFRGLQLAKQGMWPTVYRSETRSLNQSGYLGGYDVRAVAFGDGSSRLSVVAINYHNEDVLFEISDPALPSGDWSLFRKELSSPEADPDRDMTSVVTSDLTGARIVSNSAFVALKKQSVTTYDIDITQSATPGAPEYGFPVDGASINADQLFTWSRNDASLMVLAAGSAPGQSDIFHSGDLTLDESYQASGLPQDNSTIYVRLGYKLHPADTTYSYLPEIQMIAADQPIITTTPNDVLQAPRQAWTWDKQGYNYFKVEVGASIGANDLDDSGELDGVASYVSTGLPSDGSTVYFRLSYKASQGDAWQFLDRTYAAVVAPSLTDPAPNATLDANSVSLNWDDGTVPSIAEFRIKLGSAPGQTQHYDSGVLSGDTFSQAITDLPIHGETLHLTLMYRVSAWHEKAFVLTALAEQPPAPTDPVEGATVTTSSKLIQWDSTHSHYHTVYWLYLGTSAGAKDILDTGSIGNVKEFNVTGLPQDSSTIYLRIWYKAIDSNSWLSADYTFISS